MRIVMTGATGLIGRRVTEQLLARGHDVVALTRDTSRARQVLGEGVELLRWADPEREAPPAEALRGAGAVVNLLGEPIAQRWTPEVKRRIHDSRVLGTRALAQALGALSAGSQPGVLVSQSAVGYYGARGEEPVDETAAPGSDFLSEVTTAWEREALAASPAVRVVLTRTGVVLAPGGGALKKMLPPFRLGIGGPVGGGGQFVPWIHMDDVAGALVQVMEDERAAGAVNLTAPTPITNGELSRTLGRVLHRPAVVPVPSLALKLLYGEMSSIVLMGQRAVPTRLQELGYRFLHPDLEEALRDVLERQ